MKKATTALVLLGVIALIGAGVLAVKMLGPADDKAEPDPGEPTKIVYMATDGVESNIEHRLLEKSGRAIAASCPKKVSSAEGTTFTCTVRFAGAKDVVSLADVTIDGPTGDFTWTSKPVERASATPAS
jgi:hypothetical protein